MKWQYRIEFVEWGNRTFGHRGGHDVANHDDVF
jgi:hypothetical protein